MNVNNKVVIQGTIETAPEMSHEIYGEKFFTFIISSKRISGAVDNVVVMVSNRLVAIEQLVPETDVIIFGEFRSHNKFDLSGNKLKLFVFAKEIELTDQAVSQNEIEMTCFICKKPEYRVTPLGREIGDFLVACNAPYGKSYYIPCIAWGRNAKFISGLDAGAKLRINGRIQSRNYIKKISDTEQVERTAYEVSVYRIETLYEGEESNEN